MDHGSEAAESGSGGGVEDNDAIADQEEYEHESPADESPVGVVAHRDMEEFRRDMIMKEKTVQAFAKVLEQIAELKHDIAQSQRQTSAPNHFATAPILSAVTTRQQPSPLTACFWLPPAARPHSFHLYAGVAGAAKG